MDDCFGDTEAAITAAFSRSKFALYSIEGKTKLKVPNV